MNLVIHKGTHQQCKRSWTRQFICLFVCLFVETGSLYIALAVLELTLQTRLSFASWILGSVCSLMKWMNWCFHKGNGWFWATIWVLGIEPGSPGRVVSALKTLSRLAQPPETIILWIYTWWHKNISSTDLVINQQANKIDTVVCSYNPSSGNAQTGR